MATFVNGHASTVAPCCQRRVRTGSTAGDPHRRDAQRVGGGVGRHGAADVEPGGGHLVVTVIENSAVTTKGRSVVPSGGWAVAPLVPGSGRHRAVAHDRRDGAGPRRTSASSRYLGTNCAAVSLRRGVVARRAEGDADVARPDVDAGPAVEVRALDGDLGADRDRERDVAEPGVDGDAGGRSARRPRRWRWNGSKKTMPCAPNDSRGPRAAEVGRDRDVDAGHHRLGRQREVAPPFTTIGPYRHCRPSRGTCG